MRRRAESPTRERFVEAAVELIDRNGAAANVTLRDVAREVGCSPPNAYNWFTGLDDLLDAALVWICSDFLERIRRAVPADGEPMDVLAHAVRTYVEYALDNPGRLNVYHFERLSGPLGRDATAAGEAVGRAMGELLARGTSPAPEPGVADEVTAILHRYLIGRLADHITGRAPVADRDTAADDVVAEVLRLHDVLVAGWGRS